MNRIIAIALLLSATTASADDDVAKFSRWMRHEILKRDEPSAKPAHQCGCKICLCGDCRCNEPKFHPIPAPTVQPSHRRHETHREAVDRIKREAMASVVRRDWVQDVTVPGLWYYGHYARTDDGVLEFRYTRKESRAMSDFRSLYPYNARHWYAGQPRVAVRYVPESR